MRATFFCSFTLMALTVCGPARIQKLTVPREKVLLSYRLMAEGDALLMEGKDHLALLKYLESTRANPYHEVLFNKLAIAYARLQQLYRAERAVDRAIGLNPDYPFAHNTRGIIYLAHKQTKRAIRSFGRAISLRPEAANFYVNLGQAYLRDNRFEKGMDAYRKALELDPEIFSSAEVVNLPYETLGEVDPERLYRTARIFAILGERDSCLRYLGKALAAGFSDRGRLKEDTAFRPFHQDPEFVRLFNLYGIEI